MSRPRGVLRAVAFLRKRERQQLPACFLPAQAQGSSRCWRDSNQAALRGLRSGREAAVAAAGGSFKRRHVGAPRAAPSLSLCRRERRRHWENIHSNRGCERREARRCAAVVRQRALPQPARRAPRVLRSARESPVSDEWPRPSAGQNGESGGAERLLAQRERAAEARKRRTRGRAFVVLLLLFFRPPSSLGCGGREVWGTIARFDSAAAPLPRSPGDGEERCMKAERHRCGIEISPAWLAAPACSRSPRFSHGCCCRRRLAAPR